MRVSRPTVARHLHAQFPAVHNIAVQGVHSIFAVTLVVEPNEGEAAAFPGVRMPRDVDIADVPVTFEDALQVFRRGAVSQVVDLEGGHPVDGRRSPAVTHGEV